MSADVCLLRPGGARPAPGRALLVGPLLIVSVLLGLGDVHVFSDFRPEEADPRPPHGLNTRGILANVAAEVETGEPAAVSISLEVEDERTLAVRRLLAGRPLAPHAALLVGLADQRGIDWRLMPVIAILESGGGAAACGGNAWGYAACKVRFASFEEGASVVAATLAGYGSASPAHILCVWVSGGGCTTQHAVSYVYKAAPLWASLGGSFALPALPPTPDAGAEAEATSDEETATPEATPVPPESPSPTGTPAPTETPTPNRTPDTPAPSPASGIETATPGGGGAGAAETGASPAEE